MFATVGQSSDKLVPIGCSRVPVGLTSYLHSTITDNEMRVKLQKWGNSLALRIPKPFAEEAHVKQGTVADLSLADGKLVVAPIRVQSFTLEQLLAKVTNDNIHGEVDFGPIVGRESR